METCNKVEETVLEKLSHGLDTKVSKETFDTFKTNVDGWNKLYIAIFFAMIGAIGGLYVLYFTGVNDIKIDVAVIKQQVANISETLKKADIEKEK